MSRPAKLKLVDELNIAFEDLVAEKERNKYGAYMRSINEEIINNPPKSRKELKNIIKQQSVDTSVATKMFTVLNGVENLLLNEPTRKSNKLLKPLETVMNAYSVRSPKSFATAIYDMTAGRNNSEREKRFKPALLSYYDGFTENIESIEKQNQRALQRTELEVASGIFKELETLREQRVSITETKKLLIDKYNDPKRVTRALNTELHEQAERTKLEQSKFMGFTHKRWNAKDGHRPTRFHNQVKGKIVPIDSTFRAAGEEADFPGDIGLPVGERINCRCYVTYHNSPDAKINTRPIIAPPKRPKVAAPLIITPPPTRPTPTATQQAAPARPTSPRERFTAGRTLEQTRANFDSAFKNVAKAENTFFFIDKSVTKSSLEGYGQLFKKYRAFEGNELKIRSADLKRNTIGQLDSTVTSSPFMMDRFKKTEEQAIVFNFSKFRKEEDIIRSHKEEQKINWKMKVDDDKIVRYTAEHEMGHYIHLKILTEKHYLVKVPKGIKTKEDYDNQWKILNDFEEKNIGSVSKYNAAAKKMRRLHSQIAKDSGQYYADIAIERAMKEEGRDLKDKAQYTESRTSEYGKTNPKEFVAEHWAAYRLNSKPNAISKNFGKLIEELLEEVSDE